MNCRLLYFILVILSGSACVKLPVKETDIEASGAFYAMSDWFVARTFPYNRLEMKNFSKAFDANRTESNRNQNNQPNWTSIGPGNIGGRTLCLAFHPDNQDIIFAGSASGGLWKTTTAGVGAAAWTQVPTGFPVLGVGAIAINPGNPSEMYIGTGEVYDYQSVGTGFTERTNRGTYGIGILKTTNAGLSWTHVLDWSYSELRGVQDIVINPLNSNTVFAATTEGLYRSLDAGGSWTVVSDIRMAVDIELHPQDTNIVFATFGSYESVGSGIYRSTDGGGTFFKLTSGLPESYTGKSLLAISPSNPDLLYASVADAFQSKGIYKSSNGGDNWTLVNAYDVAKYQGWYSHDIAVDPTNPQRLLNGGIDMFVSSNGGAELVQITNWYEWFLGDVPAGTSEGPPNYVHADIHAIYFHPDNPQLVYVATDGGIFYSSNAGQTYQGRNGGYQTQQFYANFSNSNTDPAFAIGGMQDNASAIYKGTTDWYRVIGGDGMCTAIHPFNDSIVFASTQNMGIRRSANRGTYFTFSSPSQTFADQSGFNAPFEISVKNPDVLYAGGQRLFRSLNNGISWQNASGDMVDGGNPIVNIAISPYNAGKVLFSTFPKYTSTARVFMSNNGGLTRTQVSGLPNRIVMDITFHPADSNILYAAIAGYGTDHVYKSVTGGSSWYAVGNGLPDVPVNSIVIDPEYPEHVYISNDIGVFISKDGGIIWENYSMGLPDAVLGMHLSLSPANDKIRLATHGNGVYEGNLFNPGLDYIAPDSLFISIKSRADTLLNLVTFRLEGVTDTISAVSSNGIAAIDLPETIPLTAVIPDMPFPNEDNIVYPAVQYQYTLSASRYTNPVAGVTTFDLLQIQKHILQITPFTDPYQLIAADVSNNGLVTAQDLLQIRRVILLIDSAFSNVPSWQFFPADYVFPNPSNPFTPTPMQRIYYNPYSPDNPPALKWLGIKSGDVNFSVSSLSASAEERTGQDVELEMAVQTEATNTQYLLRPTHTFSAEGFQFGLTLPVGLDADQLVIVPFSPLTADNYYYHVDKGLLLVSWIGEMPQTWQAGTPMLSIQLKGEASEKQMITGTDHYLLPEVYSGNSISELRFKRELVNHFILNANPNPVVEGTVLRFGLESDTPLELTMSDVSGKILIHKTISGVVGENQVPLDLKWLPSGNYYCQLRSLSKTGRSVNAFTSIVKL